MGERKEMKPFHQSRLPMGDSGSDLDSSSRDGEKRLDSVYILKIEPTVCGDSLNGRDREESKMATWFGAWATGRRKLSFTEMSKTAG